MKILEQEELGGLDYTSKTIEKWDNFLKKAVWNMGYHQDLIDNMYPYEKGIPMKDGSYMPVSKKTGRVFFKISWMDMLAGMLSAVVPEIYENNSGDITQIQAICTLLLKFAESSLETFKKIFPNRDSEDFERLREYFENSRKIENLSSNIVRELWTEFVDNSDISKFSMHVARESSACQGYLDVYKDELKRYSPTQSAPSRMGGVYFIFYKPLENEYSKFPKDTFISIAQSLGEFYNLSIVTARLRNFSEVYCSNYLVVSLNPIDKLMCSTKQAFGSCMSLAKQNDVVGTNSAHAFGLPALFPSDNVFLIFTTEGKYKNMYWDGDEWAKPASERDPEKAYKYLKMSCRALTYKGTFEKQTCELLKGCAEPNLLRTTEDDKNWWAKVRECAAKLDTKREMLFVGRQYAAAGEDNVWQALVEVMLARQGVSTAMAYANEIDDLYVCFRSYIPQTTRGNWVDEYLARTNIVMSDRHRFLRLMNGEKEAWLRYGTIHGFDFACIDRFGFPRGIYYDNVSFVDCDELAGARTRLNFVKVGFCPVDRKTFHIAKNNEAKIHTGTSRNGNGCYTYAAPKTGLDAFKLMTGQQSYTYFNTYVRVCSQCGELIPNVGGGNGHANVYDAHIYKGDVICDKCMEELEIKKCEGCGQLYSKDEADEHKLYNIMEILNPAMAQEKPKMLCREQLRRASTEGSAGVAICAHCGKMETTFYSDRLAITYATKEIDGLFVKFRICSECMEHAAMCDKCKRIIFLDTLSDACLLLPNRRIICPDCIDSIRAKKEKKELYKRILSPENIADTVEPNPAKNPSLEDEAGRILAEISNTKDIGNIATRIKDPKKQIISYLQAHPTEGLPQVKPSNPPVYRTERNDEQDVVEDTLATPLPF